MTGWYKKAFGNDYLSIYEHRDIEEARRDIRDIIRLTEVQKYAHILDLCCGSGRHLRALYEEGYQRLFGLDLSPQLLKNAININDGKNIKYIQGDMRNLPFKGKFHFVMSLFTSFGYFASDMENKKVVNGVYNTLIPGGKYLLDYINRTYLENNLVEEDIIYKDNRKIQIKRWISEDGQRIEKKMVISPGGKIYNESVRLFTLDELLYIFKEQGFVNINYFGSINGDQYDETSQRVIIIGEKP